MLLLAVAGCAVPPPAPREAAEPEAAEVAVVPQQEPEETVAGARQAAEATVEPQQQRAQPVAAETAAPPRDLRGLGLYAPVEPPQTVAAESPDPVATDFYDPDSEARGLLQRAEEAVADFPRDRLGNVDWVQTLASGAIAPRSDVSGTAPGRVRDGDVIFTDTRGMPHVLFPHRQHSEWLDCSNCHPAPFVATAGANDIAMDDILSGRYCGVCHDRVAFSTFACERCHSVTHPGSPDRWW